jgi:hypothetical protein
LKKLAYVNDRATVKYIGPLLYEVKMIDPSPYDGPLGPLAHNAIYALSSMHLPNTPVPIGDAMGVNSEQLQAWKNWWETHKDYYEKLEFGQPAPPAVTTNTVARPVSATPKPSNPAAAKPSAAPVAAPQENSHSVWLIGILVALAALLGGAILWRLKRKEP